ncbi:cation:proton antiporter domain-containing protein [Actinoallomurus rhizosphaericola]|uniref:cation:proton antiporter domain-containing protein n=1 Tax=Actinoallomurus rhizosphaericola TaxID=2952536 RepID=UPI002093E428|nr:cation:proton antiporter [Actinoallomurus rhizosphaericola]MCO5995455.1 cation:proton antiporter [Actinoallomurus rhizosphaericola]
MLIATVMADIAIVLVVGAILGRLVRHLRQPPVIGEIIAGIALGPSLLGLLPGNPTAHIFPTEARPYLSAIAQVGLLIFMFGIGWEFDKRLLKGRRSAAGAVSISSIALAFALGIALATLLYSHHRTVKGHHTSFTAFALFMGAAMSITAFPVLARMLTEHRMMGTRVGALALASAAIDDVLAWCLLALTAAIVTANGAAGHMVQIGILSAVYVAAMALLVRPLLAYLTRTWVTDRVPPLYVIMLVTGIFLSSYATTWIGIHAIFGAFAFGVIMPREPFEVLIEGVKRPFDGISMVLLPVFFIVTGLNVDVSALSGRSVIELAAIVLVACVGKMVGATVPGKLTGMSWREAGTLGLLMNTRGLTELIILNVGVSLGVLDGQMFTMMVLMALVTTALAGPLLPNAPASPDELAHRRSARSAESQAA